MVEAGRSPEQADRMVHRTSMGLGAAFVVLGILLGIFRKKKLVG
jgi:hypothetical protein